MRPVPILTGLSDNANFCTLIISLSSGLSSMFSFNLGQIGLFGSKAKTFPEGAENFAITKMC